MDKEAYIFGVGLFFFNLTSPFIAVVSLSVYTTFLTPVGTTTNAMFMAAGGYKFGDYLKVGAFLLLYFLVVCLSLIPLIWPF